MQPNELSNLINIVGEALYTFRNNQNMGLTTDKMKEILDEVELCFVKPDEAPDDNKGFMSHGCWEHLCDVHKFIVKAEKYFILRDEANAMLHDDSVRHSAITKSSTTARCTLDSLLGINIPPKAE